MKTFLLAIIALLSVSVVQAGDLFKGTITYNVLGPGARGLNVLSLLGDGSLIRLDVIMTERTLSVIRNPETKTCLLYTSPSPRD